MSEKITIIIEATVNRSKLDQLRSTLTEMMTFCSETESDVNIRDWYINQEQSKCMIFHEYKNSDALLFHIGNYSEFADSINECREILSITALGNPSEKLRNVFDKVGVKRSDFLAAEKRHKTFADYTDLPEKMIIIAQAKIAASKADKLSSVLGEMLEYCFKTEPDVIARDCYFNEARTKYTIIEQYKNSDAVMFHIGNYADYVDALNECREITSVTTLGNPNHKLRKGLSQIGAKQFDLLAGEKRN